MNKILISRRRFVFATGAAAATPFLTSCDSSSRDDAQKNLEAIQDVITVVEVALFLGAIGTTAAAMYAPNPITIPLAAGTNLAYKGFNSFSKIPAVQNGELLVEAGDLVLRQSERITTFVEATFRGASSAEPVIFRPTVTAFGLGATAASKALSSSVWLITNPSRARFEEELPAKLDELGPFGLSCALGGVKSPLPSSEQKAAEKLSSPSGQISASNCRLCVVDDESYSNFLRKL